MSTPLYVKKTSVGTNGEDAQNLATAWSSFEQDGRAFWTEMDALVQMLDGVVAEEASDA